MFNQLDEIYGKPYRMIEKYPECRQYWEESGWYSLVIPPKPNELRITFLGDSNTQGFLNSLVTPHYMGNMKTFLFPQSDGSSVNMGGWPYLSRKWI